MGGYTICRVTGITEITEIPTEITEITTVITEITMEITEITMEGRGGGRYDTLGWIRIGYGCVRGRLLGKGEISSGYNGGITIRAESFACLSVRIMLLVNFMHFWFSSSFDFFQFTVMI